MALTSRKRSTFGQWLHFLLRFIGLNGLVAIAVGAFLWQGLDLAFAGAVVAGAGACAVALTILGEIRGLMETAFSHRGAAGANVALQVLLAIALVVGVNVFSFTHYKRYDCTLAHTFTLDPAIREKLAQLRGDTDIIVYVPHVSFGQRVELRQDEYDQAAEKVIIEKVKDLAEQFGELGARFRVHLLDTQKKNTKERRKAINVVSGELTDEQLAANDNPTREKPATDSELLKTIERAPDDSIFFYSRDTKQLQRLSFNDIYQLDKKASEEANAKAGNLVLNYQGVQNFADKVFKIEEKKPRIGFAVVHGWLGQEGTEDYGMPALKDALSKRGFESRDIILWKRLQREPGALEPGESRFEMIEMKKANYERILTSLADELADARKDKKFWESNKIDDINRDYVLAATNRGWLKVSRTDLEKIRKSQGIIPRTTPITDEYKAAEIKEWIEIIDELEADVAATRKRLDKALDEQSKLRVDNLAEQRRITDVRAKFNRLLADVDLLVVPRHTLRNVLREDMIPSRIYPVDDAHIEAIKDFMKAGKPVMFCLGPMMNEPEAPPTDAADDSLEKLLARFDVHMPNQTVLFNTEGDAFAELEDRDRPPGGALVEIPATTFDWRLPAGVRSLSAADAKTTSPAIRTSMRLTVRGFGGKGLDGLKIRHPRPVYVVKKQWPTESWAGAVAALPLSWPAGPLHALTILQATPNKKFDENTVFLMTDGESWNDEKPFRTDKYTPHFERPKADDPRKGTVDEKRRGPFPIGVVLESDVPRDWYDKDTPKKAVKVRLAVIGHGGLFVGDKLPPMREKLFLDVSNWLLGRDNLLARDNETWEYPRVQIGSIERTLWISALCFALPLLFLYIGANVWLVRRMR